MPNHLNRVVEQLRHLAGERPEEATDRRLLERFVAERDEASFAALVRRHGPMVLGLCRRVLGHEQDAEDAFQAAFLVLARKAASVAWQESVAGWLFTIARQISLKARRAKERRRRHDAALGASSPVTAPCEPTDAGLRAILEEEIGRLSPRQRQVVLLCYVEGQTQQQAARQLAWTPGQVRGCLDRARALLRRRLLRRGVMLPGGMLAAVLAGAAAPAAPAPAVLARAAVVFLAGGDLAGLVSSRVVSLTLGGLSMLSMSKMKILGLLLAMFLLASSTTFWPGLGAQPSTQPTPQLERAGTVQEPQRPGPEQAPPPYGQVAGVLASVAQPLVAISPDGLYVALLKDGQIRLLHADTGRILWRFNGATAGTQYTLDVITGQVMDMEASARPQLEFSADGKRLLAAVAGPRPARTTPTAESKGVIKGSTLSALLQIDDPEIRDLTSKLLKRLAERHDKTMQSSSAPQAGPTAEGGSPAVSRGTTPRPEVHEMQPGTVQGNFPAARGADMVDHLKQQLDRLQREVDELKRQVQNRGPATK